MGTTLSVTTGYGIMLPDEIDWTEHADWLPGDTDFEDPDTFDIFSEVEKTSGLKWEYSQYYDESCGDAFLAPSTVQTHYDAGVFRADDVNAPTKEEVAALKAVAEKFKIKYLPSRLVVVYIG